MAETLTGTAVQHELDDERVLAGRDLRPGIDLDNTSLFKDDVWRLGPAILQQQGRSLILDFTTIPVGFRIVLKELCYSMLSGTLPPGEPRPAILSIRGRFSQIAVFLRWLSEHRPDLHLNAVTVDDLAQFRKHLIATGRSSTCSSSICRALDLLWRYRTVLSDPLGFELVPTAIGAEYEVPSAENRTDRIPEQVHGPLMAWALRFIDDFAVDILAANKQWLASRAATKSTVGRNYGGKKALVAVLDDHIRRGQPLPGYRGKVNIRQLAQLAGCTRSTIERRHRGLVDAAVAVVGIGGHAPFDITIVGRLDGQPWIDSIATESILFCGLGKLARMLQAAAYAVIAFQSGMRDSEIKHLRRGCVQTQRDENRQIYRYKVSSLAFKGENDAHGTPAIWVVGAPAARAIAVLEQLQPPDTDLLFAHLGHGSGAGVAKHGLAEALTVAATNVQLNKFVAWINDYCAANGRSDVIPAVNGQRWILSTSQWRRTLAWFIARRPGGSIAGAIAYRHLSIQMFEGYAGTSDSGFRGEVESESALARGEHLLVMIDQHQHTSLVGPAADEAARRLEEFGQQARFQGTVVTDDRRLRRLMTRKDPAIYPGKYVTCIHNDATALCQQRRDHVNKLRPDLGSCMPLNCRNVALTAGNMNQLRAEVAEIDRELDTRPLLPPLLAHQLQQRAGDIRAFLGRHREDE
ncbi:phage integrase family protein [Mycobacteroides abscessus subsp. bolletii]|uniref:hypothetical protein n=1 Tax=Mycobacteroides abscessus TaxID=36809 RepID=UPI0009262334|nr:hypothetical protein [Mycobacteroides abscessus]SHY88530.1 phage integrase family protein [Mycobacteroides abscessus subsp. bolletii]SHZ08614.1 phage integrase family protein [Mycobacteroides abscessus subsp. bolletii]